MEDDTDPLSWWTPDGWTGGFTPDAYRQALNGNSDMITDWPKALEKAGYHHVTVHGFPDGEDNFELTVWLYPRSHLFIDIFDINGALASFFVSINHKTAFMVDRLPGLLRDFNLATVSLATLNRSVIAFIRHGQGRSTIDESGGQTLDEAERSRRRKQERETVEATIRRQAAARSGPPEQSRRID